MTLAAVIGARRALNTAAVVSFINAGLLLSLYFLGITALPSSLVPALFCFLLFITILGNRHAWREPGGSKMFRLLALSLNCAVSSALAPSIYFFLF